MPARTGRFYSAEKTSFTGLLGYKASMTHNSMKSNYPRLSTLATAAITLLTIAVTSVSGAAKEAGFVSVFDGTTLNGWKLVSQHGDGYGVKDGVIYCARGGGGNLFTEKEYADFILRFEFKLEAGSNNGIGIRAPYEGDAAYMGMEIQVLDDTAEKYANLQPFQYHGSVYGVTAAKRGALKPVGEWNVEEISAIGRQIKVTLNGKVITESDLNSITDAKTIQTHPGMLRERGHIGFLGQILEQIIECGAAKVEPALERFFNPHVKPRFNALGDKLYRDAVYQRARPCRRVR